MALHDMLPATAFYIERANAMKDGVVWQWFHCMSKSDRDTMDRELIAAKHPLAFEPGTQESRFRALCKEWK